MSWITFTVPQNRHDETFFEALSGLVLSPETDIYLALVRYHPAAQEPGTTEKQARLVDQNLSATEWGPAPSAAWPAPNERTSPRYSTCTGRS